MFCCLRPACLPACLDRRLAFACVGGTSPGRTDVLNVCGEQTLRNRATGRRSVAETYRISIFQNQDGHASERDEHREICKHRDRLWAVPLVAGCRVMYFSQSQVGRRRRRAIRIHDEVDLRARVQPPSIPVPWMVVRPNRSMEASLSFTRPSPNGNVLQMQGGSHPCPTAALCTAHTACLAYVGYVVYCDVTENVNSGVLDGDCKARKGGIPI